MKQPIDGTVTISCTNCNNRVKVPLENFTLQIGVVRLCDFFAIPAIQCKKCLGICVFEVIKDDI